MARRFASRCSLIQCTHSCKWDQHGNLNAITARMRVKWTPLLVFVTQASSMLDDTLVLWEASLDAPQTPKMATVRTTPMLTMWMAGGGVKPGFSFPRRTRLLRPRHKVHVKDLHATILALLGLNHERPTYRHAGRDFRLTDVEGRVVRELFAQPSRLLYRSEGKPYRPVTAA